MQARPRLNRFRHSMSRTLPRRTSVTLFLLVIVAFLTTSAQNITFAQVEYAILNETNWDDFVPAGKEVDAIYGDLVLRNDHIVAIIGKPVVTRNANMTVRNVGGCVIDLTINSKPNDQLSCFYPGGDRILYRKDMEGVRVRTIEASESDEPEPSYLTKENDAACTSSHGIEVVISGRTVVGNLPATTTYLLNAADRKLRVSTTVTNNTDKPVKFALQDMIRADRSFSNQLSENKRLISYFDQWFYQAYGIRSAQDATIKYLSKKKGDRKQFWSYQDAEGTNKAIPAGETCDPWVRDLIPASDWWQVELIEEQIRRSEARKSKQDKFKSAGTATTFEIRSGAEGIVRDAKVVVLDGDKTIGIVRTNESGTVTKLLKPGKYKLAVSADGRKDVVLDFEVSDEEKTHTVEMSQLGTLSAVVTDETGKPIPFKIGFDGLNNTPSPNFGPDSRPVAVRNVVYSASGVMTQGLGPGKYEAIVSHGTEYDAKIIPIEIVEGQSTKLLATLKRSVDTPGWISTEYHSHSSESGDNTSDQKGRVLNLLAEQIEFAPCTEHNRVDTYLPHLQSLQATELMATCPGMELTGSPLPQNHQNAFPMVMRPRTQDGGGPTTHPNPVVQIERLKYWDNKSEKLVQMNHPNLRSIYSDQDSNNEADLGFGKMFDHMDVVEVHPLTSIFANVSELPPPGKRGNVIFQWLQLLNQGYRMPGVINADAHYNFHGSGFYRNYVKSSTDDPSKIDTIEIVRNSQAGRIIMSSGPYLSVELKGKALEDGGTVTAEVGDDVAVDKDSVELHIKVQCPNWIDVDRVQVAVNGRMPENLNFTRRTSSGMFKNGSVKFDEVIPVKLKEDAHLIVITKGGDGLSLGRPFGPQHGKKTPIAVTNPIYVDVDGNGFQANQDRLGAPFLEPTR